MKKSLIALAVLTVSGAAIAQSTVTLSGKLNVGIQSTNGSKAAMTGGADGSDSRVIFRGTEDLGGGLKANFHMETGFKPDTGNLDNAGAVATKAAGDPVAYTSTATASQLFQRQAWGGLSGGFGEVRAGRQYTLGFFGSIGSMPSTYTDPALAVGLGFSGMGSRNNDQIQYWSPTMGGAQVRVSTQLAGDTTDASTKAAKSNEFGLSYTAGPLTANFTTASVTSTTGTKTSPMGIYGAYNFGAFAAHLGYVDKDDAANKGTVAKVTMPMGANTLFAGMAKNSTSKADAYEVGNFYALSKRTRVYALYANGSKDGATPTNGKRVALGLDHNF
jgi:predicted porin